LVIDVSPLRLWSLVTRLWTLLVRFLGPCCSSAAAAGPAGRQQCPARFRRREEFHLPATSIRRRLKLAAVNFAAKTLSRIKEPLGFRRNRHVWTARNVVGRGGSNTHLFRGEHAASPQLPQTVQIRAASRYLPGCRQSLGNVVCHDSAVRKTRLLGVDQHGVISSSTPSVSRTTPDTKPAPRVALFCRTASEAPQT
jgi:hypothetical protein